MKILLTLLLLLFAFQVSFGQEEFAEGEYWDSMHQGKTWVGEYKNFTKKDVIKGNKLFTLLKNSTSQDEWEGEYDGFAELGESRLFWNSQNGYVMYQFYHTLRFLKYGKIANTDATITWLDETDNSHKIKSNLSNIFVSKKLVKIKFGDRHFLVPENFLKNFLEIIVGVQTKDEAIYFSWLKVEDIKKESFGIPQAPAQYKFLLRLPIKAQIIKIGKTTIKRTIDEDKIEYGEVKHFITIDAGKNHKVSKNMSFYIPELDETATVIKVFSKSATAIILRDFYKTETERCWDNRDYKHELRPCIEIKVGMSAKTLKF